LDSVDLVTLVIWTISSVTILAIYGLESSLISTGKTREIFGPNQSSDLPTKKQRLTLKKSTELFLIGKLLAVSFTTASLISFSINVLGVSWSQSFGFVIIGLVALHIFAATGTKLGKVFPHKMLNLILPGVKAIFWMIAPFDPLLDRLLRLTSACERRQESDEGAGQLTEQEVVEEEVRDADSDERRMIQAILHLEDVPVREIMVPRVDIAASEINTSLEDIAGLMAEVGHSRILVYRDNIDDVIGIVHARDVLQKTSSGEVNGNLENVARPALFIPDSKPVDELLREMQDKKATVAVVVDEYGGTEGLITMEDLLEEIVGELEDEFAKEEPAIVKFSENEAILQGSVPLDELNELFGTVIEGDGFDTLGGLLSTHLGKIPDIGDTATVQKLHFQVLSTSGRRVRKVRVEKNI
jgi:CBS domain containing-hemolysin-like protein